jgi:hypothetical protein
MVRAGARRSRDGAAREEGERAAEALLEWANNNMLSPLKLSEEYQEPPARVASLAIDINQSPRPLDEKDDFARALLESPMPTALTVKLGAWLRREVNADDLLACFA